MNDCRVDILFGKKCVSIVELLSRLQNRVLPHSGQREICSKFGQEMAEVCDLFEKRYVMDKRTGTVQYPQKTGTNYYRRDPTKSGGGTQLLHAPPTAHMVHSISSLAVAVDTIGGYNWRHCGDFSVSIFNPPNRPILYQNLRKKIIRFFWLV